MNTLRRWAAMPSQAVAYWLRLYRLEVWFRRRRADHDARLAAELRAVSPDLSDAAAVLDRRAAGQRAYADTLAVPPWRR